MKKTFFYNILQYHHSLILNESVNVGILFVFSSENIIRYVPGSLDRVKSLYPNFDTGIVDKIVKGILKKISHRTQESLFAILPEHQQLEEHQKLLRSDDSSLQFTTTKKAVYPFDIIEDIIREYSNLLLPNSDQKELDEERNDDQFILKTFTGYLLNKLPSIDNLIRKNQIVESQGISLKFDYAWKNGTLNYIKPISFDLKKPQLIQTKSITYFGYLTKLKDYAIKNKARFDLLVSQPRNEEFLDEYFKALKTIESSKAPTQIVTENKLKEYSEETASYLAKRLDQLGEDPF